MDIRGDRRAQAMQVGAVVLVGVAIVALSAYQVTSVPSQNRQVEAAHSEQVTEQLLGVREAVLDTARTGSPHSALVSLGTEYPGRVVAVNPSPATGTLRTVRAGPTGLISVTNATALGPETADYWNGSEHMVRSRAIGYTPQYNEFANAPTTGYGSSLLYTVFGTDPFSTETAIRGGEALSNQTIIDGNRITLVTLDGGFSERGSDNVSVEVRPVTVSNTTIPLRNTTGEQVELSLSTWATNESWQATLTPELTENGGSVESFACSAPSDDQSCGVLTIRLAPTDSTDPYELRMAKVGVGTDVSDEPPRYLTNVSDRRVSVPENATRELVLEVRDRYNNPVPNSSVNVSIIDRSVLERLGSGAEDPTPMGQLRVPGARGGTVETMTNENGQAVVRYRAPRSINGSGSTNLTVIANRTGQPDPIDRETANATAFDLTVTNTDSSPVAHRLRWNRTALESQAGVRCGANRCIYNRSQGQLTVPVEANATGSNESVPGATVTFATRDPAIASYVRADNATDATGRATATINVSQPGTTALGVAGGTNTVGGPAQLTLTVGNRLPNAAGAYAPQNATSGTPIQFDARASNDPDGRITEYQWAFGDGSRTFGPRPRHTYNTSGTYNATLTVTDNDGAQSTTNATVTIANRPPEAAFEYPLTVPSPNQSIGFDASGSTDPDGEIVRYEWDFGDGSQDVTASIPTTSHSFNESGTYIVSLRVTDDAGNTDVIQKSVTVSQ
jgi:PKD repeat protein